jgi:4-amino-4-deoxy-L-arabinose transferase-like glycosyltransferase
MASLLDRWLDGVEEGWGIPLLLAIFVVLWTAFLALAYQNADLHPDVIEAWTIGRTLDWSGAKHPPLMGWVTHIWTLLFPVRDWSFHLLAMVNSALALWVVDLTARRFVSGDKRAIILLLLMLLPVYQFQAQRFNANSVLFAVWPLAIYCFLRSFETRSAVWAVAAGLAGALAILGKYYSAFLIVGFVFAAICHPGRRTYFTSAAPWVSAVAGMALLAPHAHWMLTSGTSPLGYIRLFMAV